MKYFTFRRFLPSTLKTPLWGNRKKWGLIPDKHDTDWKTWEKTYDMFYSDNQRSGIGLTINDAGYKIMSHENFNSKIILEIGSGDIRHIKYWKSDPNKYLLADIDKKMIFKGEKALEKKILI